MVPAGGETIYLKFNGYDGFIFNLYGTYPDIVRRIYGTIHAKNAA
jgi:hypothetical protein